LIRDLYAEAGRLADGLNTLGLSERAHAIRGAIARGATGTEILMDLRHELDALAGESDLPLVMKSRALSIRAGIDALL
jgi:hypothetical protein